MEKKISLPEIILLNLYVIPLDLIGLVLVFFGLDDFWIIEKNGFTILYSDTFIQWPRRLIILINDQDKEKIKDVLADLVVSVIELIPYVGALPIKSIGMNISIYLTNHPEKMEKLAATKLANPKNEKI